MENNIIQGKLRKFFANVFVGKDNLKRLTESFSTSGTIDSDDHLYRRSATKGQKGLNPVTRDRQDQIVYRLFLTNGITKRILEIIIDFVFGDGFTYSFGVNAKKLGIDNSTDEGKKKIQNIIDQCFEVCNEFWKENKMDLRFENHYQDLRLYGRLLQTVFVNKINGSVKLGYIDVTNVDKVITNPDNVEEVQQIKLKGIGGGKKTYEVIKEVTDPANSRFGLLDGECFFFSINRVSNQPEGVSDFLASADFLDVLDNIMFKTMDLLDAQTTYIEDVEVQGSPDQVKKYESEDKKHVGHLAKRYHNEKVKHTFVAPEINATETTELIRMVKNFTLGTQGIPEFWFADGGNTNLATAEAQQYPTIRKMKKIQQYAVYMLQTILTFVLHQAFNKRQGFNLSWDELMSVNIEINRPELETKNYNKISDGISKTEDALTKAVAAGYLSRDTAGTIMRSILDIFGFGIDSEIEKQKIETENEKQNKTKEPEAE
jgi:hypothetical protein